MKTIIKLVIAGVFLTAAFQAGAAAFNNFQFEDAAQQRLLFDARATPDEVVAIVMKIAGDYQIPLKEENIEIRNVAQDRIVEMHYDVDINLIPGVYKHKYTFAPKTSTRVLQGVGR